MAKPDFQPKILYSPETDHLSVINVADTSRIAAQSFDKDTLGFWKGKRLVGLAMLRASVHLNDFMTEHCINSPSDLTKALDKLGDEKNLSRRGAARRFINDAINGTGYDEYRIQLNNSSI